MNYLVDFVLENKLILLELFSLVNYLYFGYNMFDYFGDDVHEL